MPKLTLSMDKRTIQQAKQIAAENGTSISKLLSRFIASLSHSKTDCKLGPITRKATGLIDLQGLDEKEILTNKLSEKYNLK